MVPVTVKIGAPIELDHINIKWSSGTGNNKVEVPLVEGKDFIVTAYYNNVKKGTASLGKMRQMKTKDIVKKLNEILVGYYHYYGITDNLRSLKTFRYEVLKSLFYWLNRRSQKKSYNRNDFWIMISTLKLVPVTVNCFW